ncbi:hypothetical protein QR680_015158 [Steinernema hermaphroditum]|uniref:Uncharacterized protein n=1 Tax=Steinernema hermaphroditum TaxID=289476 RepID=A0AA39IDX9_9BILA|nr:hypothetical protein QR680_015158 [Steinernema hermaphroditum]
MDPLTFDGKVAIVTGSSSGIGRAIALRLAKQGAMVTIHGLDLDEVQEAREVFIDSGISESRIVTVAGDLRKHETAEQLIKETVKTWDRIDILVNNAGMLSKPGVPQDSEENFDFLFEVNVKAMIRLTTLAIPFLEKTKGTIINTSSITGLTRMIGVPTFYAMTKAAIVNYVQYEAPKLADKGIRMNIIAPGIVKTKITIRAGLTQNDFDEVAKESCEKEIPMGRIGTPDEIAKVVSFLASEDASFMCGATVVADGGAMLGKG